jgi:hypothetical protein
MTGFFFTSCFIIRWCFKRSATGPRFTVRSKPKRFSIISS